jgi:acyl-coenzyme A synthetase/AMP-(fatty) acid ligase
MNIFAFSSLRSEPINPEAWKWYFEVVGGSKVGIVDTFWQVRLV